MTDWAAYILRCADNTLYTGISNRIERRVAAHNAGRGAKYTRTRLPVVLVWRSGGMSHSDAARLEYEIKQKTREQKLAMVNNDSSNSSSSYDGYESGHADLGILNDNGDLP